MVWLCIVVLLTMMLPRGEGLIGHVVDTVAFAFAVPCVWVQLKSKAPVQ